MCMALNDCAGYLWVYLVPQWVDDVLEQLSTKWRNTLLFIYYGEDFTYPPPLEVDETAVHPVRTPEEEDARFQPKHGFQASSSFSSVASFPGSAPPSPTRKSRRREQQRQQQQRQQQQQQEEPGGLEGEEGAVWDPTWGVISREVQSLWREQARQRGSSRERRQQQQQRPLPPVRLPPAPR